MRVAWITYDFEEYSTLHVNAMADDNDVLLVMPRAEEGSPRYDIHPKIDHYSFDKPRLRQPLRQLQSIRRILAKIESFQPDVVHLQQGHMWFNAALKYLKPYPLVITIHDPRHHAGDVVSQKTPQWLMDYGFRKANHAIVHGETLVAKVHEHFQIQQQHIHVIPHVAMGGEYIRDSIPEESNNVLFFGRIWQYKGLEYLIRAEPAISSLVPDVNIVIAGEGDDFSYYENLIQNPDRFSIHNRWISDAERAEMFQRAAIVVLPYIEATQSGVVPVAYNFHKPVVATRVGALSECVEHEKTGLLISPRCDKQLSQAIVRLLKNPDERHRMGSAGRRKLDNECSADVVAQQTLNVYRQAIANSPASKSKRQHEVAAS